MDEGYIKYKCQLIHQAPPDEITIQKLNNWRSKLHSEQLVGVNEDGVGYGNVSRRYRDNQFWISGTSTGHIPILTASEYVLITALSIRDNSVTGYGLVNPSSESMTHGIIYQSLPAVRCILHVHDFSLWDKYKNVLPTTGEHIAYGTPEMAMEVKRLILSLSPNHSQVIVMGGHLEGVLVYGTSPNNAGERLMRLKSGLV